MTSTLRAITLIGATMTMGLTAGTFMLYAHTIMPGLARTDDRTFVSAFQHTDRAIINPWFMATAFLGALVFTAAAAVTSRGTPAASTSRSSGSGSTNPAGPRGISSAWPPPPPRSASSPGRSSSTAGRRPDSPDLSA